MESLFDDICDYAERLATSGRLKTTVIVFAVLGFLLAVGGLFLGEMKTLQITVGAIAGLLWFIAGYMFIHSGLDADRKAKLNLRETIMLPRRRAFVAGAALLWLILIGLLGRGLNGSLLGAANVAVLLTLWRLFSATPTERETLDRAMEAMWSEENEPQGRRKSDRKRSKKKAPEGDED